MQPRSSTWPAAAVEDLIRADRTRPGLWLFLGATDTGKTTLIEALTARLTSAHSVAIVDADVGQSHIGPPTTVGWAPVKPGPFDLSATKPDGMVFVGDVTPVGHLLQLTTAIALCTRAASAAAEIILIDTPGYVADSAAAALWWNLERLLQPSRLVALRRAGELDMLLKGLHDASSLDVAEAPAGIPAKSPEQRRLYRQSSLAQYFRGARVQEIPLDAVALRTAGPVSPANIVGRLVGLGTERGFDLALGIVESYKPETGVLVVRSPLATTQTVRCVTIGCRGTDFTR